MPNELKSLPVMGKPIATIPGDPPRVGTYSLIRALDPSGGAAGSERRAQLWKNHAVDLTDVYGTQYQTVTLPDGSTKEGQTILAKAAPMFAVHVYASELSRMPAHKKPEVVRFLTEVRDVLDREFNPTQIVDAKLLVEQLNNTVGRAVAESMSRCRRVNVDPNVVSRALHIVLSRYAGCCPCGCGVQIVGRDGKAVGSVEIDHYRCSAQTTLIDVWPLKKACHTERHNAGSQPLHRERWIKAFHRWELIVLEEERLSLRLRKSMDTAHPVATTTTRLGVQP